MATPTLSAQPEADWSQLPKDLFDSILERLVPLDLIRVSSVCSTWRSITPTFDCWLILPCNYNDNHDYSRNGEEAMGFLGVVSLSDPDRKVRKLRLAEAAGRLICGSSAGWLVTLQSNGEIRLLQPFTRAHIQLPQLTFAAFSDLPKSEGFTGSVFIAKVIVGLPSLPSTGASSSSDSSASFKTDGVVLVMCQKPKKLAFYRPGKDQNWATFEGYSGHYKDIAYHKGRFYAIRNKRHVYVASGLEGPSPTMEKLIEIPKYPRGTKYYLVESSGDLLLVLRHVGWRICNSPLPSWAIGLKTTNFCVFKLDLSGRNLVKVKNIGDHALFLDRNTAVSVPASDIRGCKSNHIYFISTCFAGYSNESFGSYDMGVFNLEDRRFEPFKYCNDLQLIMRPPIWYPTYTCWRGGL